jgi:hypothetical protein
MEGLLIFNLKNNPEGTFRSAKPAAKRSKAGCLNCRVRRKKCGEEKPICTGCKNNHLLCSWPEAEGASPSQATSIRLQDALMDHDHAQQHTILIQNNSNPSKIPWATQSGYNISTTITKMPMHWPQLKNQQAEKRLIQYFVERTAQRLLVIDNWANPFLQFVLPMTVHDDTLLHIVLSISASHMSYGDESMKEIAMSHYAIALRSVKYQITDAALGRRTTSLELLIVLLTLCQFEVGGLFICTCGLQKCTSTGPIR